MFNCEHNQTILISGTRADEHYDRISICRECGEIHVSATVKGVHFTTRFSLHTNFLLLAASQAYRRYIDPEAGSVLGKRIWKPFDFADQRLYQVHREWDIGTRNFKQDYVVAGNAPADAAALIENHFEEFYKLNNVTFHFAHGRPLAVYQPEDWTINGLTLLHEDIGEVFVPGEFVCAKCGFRLSQRILSMMGEVGVNPSTELPTCRKDGQLMQRVSWRQAAADAGKMAQDYFARLKRLEDAWPEGHAMPVQDDLQMDPPLDLQALVDMDPNLHTHRWEIDYSQPTFDVNPVTHFVKCPCGATGQQSEGSDDVHDIVEPNEATLM